MSEVPIEVFVRHCVRPSSKKNRPKWFSKEVCWENLLNTSNRLVNITVVLDGELDERLLEKYSKVGVLAYSHLEGGNDAKSFLYLLNYVLSRPFSDEQIVYLVEDDYIHTKNWVEVLLDGFENTKVEYITLYDHKDKYFLSQYEELTSKIFQTKLSHWRTIPSTTNTYAMRFGTLKRDKSIHIKYCDLGAGWTRDHEKFLELGCHRVSLISSLPGCSTHCEIEYMSPVIDWDEVIKQTS